MNCRLLGRDDISAFKEIMESYYIEESTKVKSVYPIESIRILVDSSVNYFVNSFDDGIRNGYLVSGMFEDGTLVGIAIGRKINHLWGLPNTTLPCWILVLTYMKDKNWSSPLERLHSLISPVITTMENDRFYSWYKVSKFSNTVTHETLQNYIDKVYSKVINAERYDVIVEEVVNSQLELDKIESTHRRMFPAKIHDNVRLVLLQHTYKNSLRSYKGLQ